jgi:histidinol dehydrogenase
MNVLTADKWMKTAGSRSTYQVDQALQRGVTRILNEVRRNGDRALVKYTKRFDGVDLDPKRIRVKEGDINRAYERIDVKFVPLLKQVTERVRRFYRKELTPRSFRLHSDDGVLLEGHSAPIERIGIYVPGGTSPLVSTVYMTVLPAQIAGVSEIALASPPSRNGEIDPHILVVANLLGVKEIYRVGGAQAIAGLAFGTKTITKVDKIVGPGNPYVTEAKRQVFGFCGIDMVAGPSEICIVADKSANPEWVAADLAAQGEHYLGEMYLITHSQALVEAVRDKLESGTVILVNRLEEAFEISNLIGPEHLQIMTKSPRRWIKKVRHAGAIFLGSYSPAVVGDYVAGPSHVLPTGGSARFCSSLGLPDFRKRSHIVTYSREGLQRVNAFIEHLTQIEGMVQHGRSASIRFKKGESSEEKKS